MHNRHTSMNQTDGPQEAIGAQEGMATAELLGNAALGIGALVVIWGLLQSLGVNVISWMGQQIGIG